tara:strand:- start:228 stop:1136 length:909 start_codon:yes stop_codon:yes gene_type:complete
MASQPEWSQQINQNINDYFAESNPDYGFRQDEQGEWYYHTDRLPGEKIYSDNSNSRSIDQGEDMSTIYNNNIFAPNRLGTGGLSDYGSQTGVGIGNRWGQFDLLNRGPGGMVTGVNTVDNAVAQMGTPSLGVASALGKGLSWGNALSLGVKAFGAGASAYGQYQDDKTTAKALGQVIDDLDELPGQYQKEAAKFRSGGQYSNEVKGNVLDTYLASSYQYTSDMNKKTGGRGSFLGREARQSFVDKAESQYTGIDVGLSGQAHKYDVMRDDAMNTLAELRGLKTRYEEKSPWSYVGQAIGDIV